MNEQLKPESSRQVGKNLAEVIHKTEKLFNEAGFSHKKTTLDVWGIFDKLPEEQCLAILEAAQIRHDIMKDAIIKNIPFESNKKSLRAALQKLGLSVPDDLYSRIDKDVIIDIYNSNHLQIYHNKVFHELSSFSYLELSALPWFELFERPSYCTLHLFQLAEELFLSGRKGIVDIDLDDYCLKEKIGNSRLECVFHHEFVCPAVDSEDRVKALVYGNKITQIFPSDGKLEYL